MRTAAVATVLTLAGCSPSDRSYREAADSPRASPAATPTVDARPDSTSGVARSTGQPGVAGDTVARSSKISAPKSP